MREEKYARPDPAAMARLLARHPSDVTGLILHLAWRAGLTRNELCDLVWDDIDFETRRLRLADRDVPLEQNTADVLHSWHERYERWNEFVVISERDREPLAPQSISRLVRRALDEEGQTEVRLVDLRGDYILRQFEEHDWHYALRVTGISLSTYRALFNKSRGSGLKDEPSAEQDSASVEWKLHRLLQSEGRSPVGLAIRLTRENGLMLKELVALTWDDIDLRSGTLTHDGRTSRLTGETLRLLKEEKAHRRKADDPHVLLTPRSRKPLTVARLSTIVRGALVHAGIDDWALHDFRGRDEKTEQRLREIVGYAEEHGSIRRKEIMEMFDVTVNIAYGYLVKLTERGDLVRINNAYYPAGRVVRPERQREAIIAYLREKGEASLEELTELLHIGKRTTERLLTRMGEDGQVTRLRASKRYTLPPKPWWERGKTGETHTI